MHVLITGATRGIGQKLSQIALADGHNVIATSRGQPGAEQASWMTLDVTDPASVTAMAKNLAGTPLDLLVLNAGVYLDRGQTLSDGFGPDLWAQTFAANVTGPFLCVQALLPNLRLSNDPKIAIVSSRMGSNGQASGGSYIYRASKAAVTNLASNLAKDLASDSIAVGAYHPGWVRTDMGGAEADLDVTTSATGLWDRFKALSLSNSGCFENYDGTRLPF